MYIVWGQRHRAGRGVVQLVPSLMPRIVASAAGVTGIFTGQSARALTHDRPLTRSGEPFRRDVQPDGYRLYRDRLSLAINIFSMEIGSLLAGRH